MRRGIILAGGAGTRLAPLTSAISKQLLPVYDKPMIYYPLSVLMLAGVREILIITAPESLDQFQRLLGDGSAWGLRLSYVVQPRPEGLAQAYLLGEDFVAGEPSVLILGDNLYYGDGLRRLMTEASAQTDGATVFAIAVNDPERYGVVEIDRAGRALGIEEKPARPKSRFAVTGLYFYDGRASALAHTLRPSARGELEITDLNRLYLEEGRLRVQLMGRGYAWLDTGTFDSLVEASEFVRTVQKRTGLMICALEEVAFAMGFIDAQQLLDLAGPSPKNPYFIALRETALAALAGEPIPSMPAGRIDPSG